MCFSATASFGVSAGLLISGIASIKQVDKSVQIPFATIPLIFSVQQFCEGIIWTSFSNEEYESYAKIFTYVFLTFAQVVWPIWVPLSIWLLEKNKNRKKILGACLAIGTAVSFYVVYCLIKYNVYSSVAQHHIRYENDFPFANKKLIGILYFIPTVLSPIISSINKMWILGAVILVSFLTSKLFFGEYVISVWCFFAAVISICIFYIMKYIQRFVIEIN